MVKSDTCKARLNKILNLEQFKITKNAEDMCLKKGKRGNDIPNGLVFHGWKVISLF